MPSQKPKFTISDVEVSRDEVVFDGFFKMHKLSLKHRLFGGGWSEQINRELFHRGEASAAVLYDPVHDTIGLIEQFRVGALDSEYSPWCLEVVAGMLERGESPDGLMRRELFEEAGIKEAELIHISSYYSTPGGCSEKIHLYCAVCDLSNSGGLHGLQEEHEDILLHIFAAEEVFTVMLKSRMNNAATLLGLQWLQLNRASLRKSI
ncbi:MAG: ADP-ribose pyrophosphatase [Lentisphaeria bacterium]|jgi:ADP-ribose pyrophosphatase